MTDPTTAEPPGSAEETDDRPLDAVGAEQLAFVITLAAGEDALDALQDEPDAWLALHLPRILGRVFVAPSFSLLPKGNTIRTQIEAGLGKTIVMLTWPDPPGECEVSPGDYLPPNTLFTPEVDEVRAFVEGWRSGVELALGAFQQSLAEEVADRAAGSSAPDPTQSASEEEADAKGGDDA